MRGAALLAACCWLLWPGDALLAKDGRAQLLTRSIYVPLEITLCPHLREAVLYQDEQPVSLLPAKRIFQFTYYPGLSRVEPRRSDLRVEARRSDGSAFVGNLAVTPWSVVTANGELDLDMERQLDKMRFQLDTRYRPVTVRVRCADSCALERRAVPSRSVLEQ